MEHLFLWVLAKTVQGKLHQCHHIFAGRLKKFVVLRFVYSGLRLNEDLTRGSTSKSIGFDNEELIAEGAEVFEVGLGTSFSFCHSGLLLVF